MNKNLQDLLNQATEDCMGMKVVNQQKFAELIVMECANIVHESDHFRGKYILEHFGVEYK